MRTPLIARHLTAPAAAALCLPLAFSPAFAAKPNELQYLDLDLDTPQGKAALDKRISAIARKICADEVTTGTRLSGIACHNDVRDQLLAAVSERQSRVGKGG